MTTEHFILHQGIMQSVAAYRPEDLWSLPICDRQGNPIEDQEAIYQALGIPLTCPWEPPPELYVKAVGGLVPDGATLRPSDGVGYIPLRAAEDAVTLVVYRGNDDPGLLHFASGYQRAFDRDEFWYWHPVVRDFLEWTGSVPAQKYELSPEDLPEAPEPPTKQQPLLVDMSDALKNPTEPKYVIDGILEDETTNALVAPSGSGKTFVALDLLLSTCTGRPWTGHEIKRPGPVVGVFGEGRPGVPRRVQAWLHDTGVGLPPGRFFMTQAGLEIDEAGARRLTTEIEQIAAEHGNPVMLAFDTVARVMPGDSDENSAKDMMAFVGLIDRLRDRFRCVVLLVNHVGHAEETRLRARGSSAFGAAMDSIIVMDTRKKHLVWTKMKDSESPEPLPYSLEPCAPSAVVRYGSEATPPAGEVATGQKKLGKAVRLGLETLQRVCQENGQPFADIGSWRFEFFRSHWADGADAKRKAFDRAKKDLVDADLIRVEDDNYSILTPDKMDIVQSCPDNVRGVERTDTDTLLKECPVVRTLPASEVQVFGDEDFGEVEP